MLGCVWLSCKVVGRIEVCFSKITAMFGGLKVF